MCFICLLSFMLAADPKPKPVAMVLSVEDAATLHPGTGPARPLRESDFLLPGDRLVANKGSVRLVLLADGRCERLPPGAKVLVSADGCTPAEVVQKQPVKLSKPNLRGLRELAVTSGSGAAGVIRSGKALTTPEARVTPMNGSTVLTQRPTLTWQPAPGAATYVVRVYSGQGAEQRREWQAETKQPSLEYPAKQSELPTGVVRYWEVTAKTSDGSEKPVVKGKFSVATEAELKQLAPLKKLAASEDPTDWLMAAAVYEAHGAFDDALPLYKKLAEKRPMQAHYWVALAHYYVQAGLQEEAAAARKQAEKLGVPVGK